VYKIWALKEPRNKFLGKERKRKIFDNNSTIIMLNLRICPFVLPDLKGEMNIKKNERKVQRTKEFIEIRILRKKASSCSHFNFGNNGTKYKSSNVLNIVISAYKK